MKSEDKITKKHLTIEETPDCYGHHAYVKECAKCFCEVECQRKDGLH